MYLQLQATIVEIIEFEEGNCAHQSWLHPTANINCLRMTNARMINDIFELTSWTGIQITALKTIPKGQIMAKLMCNHFFLKWVLCQMGWTISIYLVNKNRQR